MEAHGRIDRVSIAEERFGVKGGGIALSYTFKLKFHSKYLACV